MTLVELVVRTLDAHRVPHALIGAAALASAGVSRSTFDVDLLTTDGSVLAESIWTPVRAAGASVDVRRGDVDDPLAGVVRVELSGDRPVDVIVGRHAWQARAVARAIGPPGELAAVQPRDLILLKLYAGGTQDLWDIRELLAGPDGARLAVEVDADIASQPERMRELWRDAQR